MEDDKKVKDSTVPDKAPEKNLKKPSGKSATGKPLDGIDINPQLNDVSTDGNQLKIRKEDSVDLAAPVIQERKALTLPQRQKRARQLRAREHTMERAREVAKTKLAPTTQLEKRAISHARAIVKKRFAARKGTPYTELTTTEKIQVDTAVAKKTKLIQKIAARLLPRIRKAEFERLQSFRNGGPLKDLSTQNPKAQGIMPKVTEEMSQLFNTLNDQDVTSLIGIIENAIAQFNHDNDPMGDQLKKMLTAVLPEDVVTESLLKKSDKTGIPFSTLKEVFERGEYSWDDSNRMSQEQYAFARVNSYIGKGRAWHMDADLREEKTVNAKLDESFTTFLEAMDKSHPIVKEYNALKKHDIKTLRGMISQSGGVVDTSGFKSKDHAASHIIRSKHGNKKVDRAFGFAEETQATKIIDETMTHGADMVNMQRGHMSIEAGLKKYSKKQIRDGIKAINRFSTKLSHPALNEASAGTKERKKIEVVDRPPASQAVKTRQQEIQKKIIDESGNKPYVKSFSQNDSGEHSGWKASNKHGKVKYFGKDFKASAMKHAGVTEEVATSLDESFNMAWTSGIGVTLSAADCGIKIKGGFSLHPDVIEQMDAIEEDVVAADKKPVYMPPRRHKDGSFGKASTAMRRTGKKIIDVKEPEDVDSDEHDGK